MPNLPILFWGVFVLLQHFVQRESWHTALGWLSFASIVTWAVLEIVYGVNYFRRALGLVVLVVVLTSKCVSLLR